MDDIKDTLKTAEVRKLESKVTCMKKNYLMI